MPASSGSTEQPVDVIIRVDASRRIGAGHVMRCLALADALRVGGARSCFVSRHLPDSLAGVITAHGHQLVRIGMAAADEVSRSQGQYSEWLGVGQEEDARDTAAVLARQNCDWLVVDHYALDCAWERKLRVSAQRILAIDDLADRNHDCDVLVDQNFYENADQRYIGKVPDGCQTLLGPQYALLREEFGHARQHARPREGRVRRILVFLGGADAGNHTSVAIEALEQLDLGQVAVDVVIGADHPQRATLEASCKENDFTLHVQTSRMGELMMAADLAIGAGGTASWERCCLGLPTLAICAAENQEQLLRDAARAGVLYAPTISPAEPDAMARHVRALIENPTLLALISRNGLRLVDARGAQRVLRAMGIVPVTVRPVLDSDAAHLFAWRNHPAIRQVSRSTAPIEWSAHSAWLTAVLGDGAKALLIGELAGRPVGVVRFDVTGQSAEVSIYMVPGEEGRGSGVDVLLAAEQWISRHRPDVRCLDAEVLGENLASRQLFRSAGYQAVSTRLTKRMD